MDFIKADKLSFDPREQMSRIFTEGFYQWLNYFAKDKDKLTQAFEHVFDLSRFYVAVDGDKIAAITGCVGKSAKAMALDKKGLRKSFGLIVGNIAYTMLNKYLINPKYPFEITENMGIIAVVAASPGYKRQGAAYRLMEHVMENERFSEYVLEVVDNNAAAIKLYEKLGFEELTRRKSQDKRSGFDFHLYMRRKWD